MIFGVALAGLISIPAVVGLFSYQMGVAEADLNGDMVAKWREVLKDQQAVIEEVRFEAENNIEASAARIAQLQARIVRLDALGERLTKIGRLEEGEFDFLVTAMGGPENSLDIASYEPPAWTCWISWPATLKTANSNSACLKRCLRIKRCSGVFLAGVRQGLDVLGVRPAYRSDYRQAGLA